MGAGLFRHRVCVRIPSGTDDGAGGQPVTWTNGRRLWAQIEPVSAREQALAGAVQTIATHRVTLYYDEEVLVTRRLARIAPTGPELQILGVRDLGGVQRLLEVDCAEVVAEVV